ncbi:MAG: tetraacyldisaccharide 4'-kinase, partial [Candidatus Aminicenantales bacterium]
MKLLIVFYSALSRPVCRFKRALLRKGILRAEKAPLPVFSVGNLALGGSEKTPLAMDLLEFLLEIGRKPALVTRGYKGAWERTGGVLSDGRTITGTWREGGDEPFLAARRHPGAGVYVGKDRLQSCRRARDAGFDVAVLDDGFQHLRLRRDLDIVLYDPAARTPLREGPAALAAADIVLEKDRPGVPALRTGRPKVFAYSVREQGIVPLEEGPPQPLAALRGRRIFAFCGIARPERFFELLEAAGSAPAARAVFPDHFDYPDRSLDRLADSARAADCPVLLTTEKDAVK